MPAPQPRRALVEPRKMRRKIVRAAAGYKHLHTRQTAAAHSPAAAARLPRRGDQCGRTSESPRGRCSTSRRRRGCGTYNVEQVQQRVRGIHDVRARRNDRCWYICHAQRRTLCSSSGITWLILSICCTQRAACSVQHAACNAQHEARNVRSGARTAPCTGHFIRAGTHRDAHSQTRTIFARMNAQGPSALSFSYRTLADLSQRLSVPFLSSAYQ